MGCIAQIRQKSSFERQMPNSFTKPLHNYDKEEFYKSTIIKCLHCLAFANISNLYNHLVNIKLRCGCSIDTKSELSNLIKGKEGTVYGKVIVNVELFCVNHKEVVSLIERWVLYNEISYMPNARIRVYTGYKSLLSSELQKLKGNEEVVAIDLSKY